MLSSEKCINWHPAEAGLGREALPLITADDGVEAWPEPPVICDSGGNENDINQVRLDGRQPGIRVVRQGCFSSRWPISGRLPFELRAGDRAVPSHDLCWWARLTCTVDIN